MPTLSIEAVASYWAELEKLAEESTEDRVLGAAPGTGAVAGAAIAFRHPHMLDPSSVERGVQHVGTKGKILAGVLGAGTGATMGWLPSVGRDFTRALRGEKKQPDVGVKIAASFKASRRLVNKFLAEDVPSLRKRLVWAEKLVTDRPRVFPIKPQFPPGHIARTMHVNADKIMAARVAASKGGSRQAILGAVLGIGGGAAFQHASINGKHVDSEKTAARRMSIPISDMLERVGYRSKSIGNIKERLGNVKNILAAQAARQAGYVASKFLHNAESQFLRNEKDITQRTIKRWKLEGNLRKAALGVAGGAGGTVLGIAARQRYQEKRAAIGMGVIDSAQKAMKSAVATPQLSKGLALKPVAAATSAIKVPSTISAAASSSANVSALRGR